MLELALGTVGHPYMLMGPLHRAHGRVRRSAVWANGLIGVLYLFIPVLGYGAEALVA